MTKSVGNAVNGSAPIRTDDRDHLAVAFLRVALGVGFLSAVADRFGLWGPPGHPLVAWGDFHNFLLYTAGLNPWCPLAWIPLLGILVTIAEAGLGVLLILGLFTRVAALLTGILTFVFAMAMTIVLGVHAPLNYSVFVFSAASFLLRSQVPDNLSIDRRRQLKRSHGEPRGKESFAN